MSNHYGRPAISRARQRAQRKKQLIIGGCAAALAVAVVLVILLLPKGGSPDRTQEAVAQQSVETVEQTAQQSGVEIGTGDEPDTEYEGEASGESSDPLNEIGDGDISSPEEEAAEIEAPQATPAPEAAVVDSNRALTRPEPTQAGFMPVFTQADTEEKIIAITVDDCFQADNLRQIVDKAIEVGGKLTIFPIGKNAIKKEQSEILKYAWENGFELENHTFTHNGLFAASNEELAEEVYTQQLALSYILGVEYHCHFLRPRGGDARGDQRMHMYAKQMGYYGIAHWSVSGSSDDSRIAKGLKPGAIFLFHTTGTDLDKLLRFIPWAVEKGYQLVTLNEMFGYPANETGELTTPISEHTVPPLEPYEMVYVPLKKTAYCWEAYLLQEKLIEMGYLTGKPDGVYGNDCEAAIRKYQKDHGMEETGVADSDLVRTIIEGTSA